MIGSKRAEKPLVMPDLDGGVAQVASVLAKDIHAGCCSRQPPNASFADTPNSFQTGSHYPPDLTIHAADIHPKSQQLPAHTIGFTGFVIVHPGSLYRKQSFSGQ